MALVHAVGASDQADDLGVVEETVEHGAHGGVVAEDLASVLEGPVAGQDGGALSGGRRRRACPRRRWLGAGACSGLQ
jgi:hypothetical protein